MIIELYQKKYKLKEEHVEGLKERLKTVEKEMLTTRKNS